MIKHLPNQEEPRITAKALATFVYSSENARKRILRAQKFAQGFRMSYYKSAEALILRSLSGNRFDRSVLADGLKNIQPKKESKQHKARVKNNRAAISMFEEIADLAAPELGEITTNLNNSTIIIDGVAISVRPEIVSKNKSLGTFSYTKLHFSKENKISADAAEIVLLLMLRLGQMQPESGLSFDLQKSKLIDCFTKNIVFGHNLERYRERQLAQSLKEIRAMWPLIQERDVRPRQIAPSKSAKLY